MKKLDKLRDELAQQRYYFYHNPTGHQMPLDTPSIFDIEAHFKAGFDAAVLALMRVTEIQTSILEEMATGLYWPTRTDRAELDRETLIAMAKEALSKADAILGEK